MSLYQEKLTKLMDELNSREELSLLKEVEEKIFSNEECLSFINAFSFAQEEYNFVLSHFKNDEELIEKRKKELILAKREMDNHPLIKKYNDLYLKISEPTIYLEKDLKKILTIKGEHKC